MLTPRFEGTIGDDWRTSTPWWPPEPSPPEGAPNVVLIVLDDVGFAQLGCYGSNLATPRIDDLAASGARLSNFHTTALCSPTRSCLLTGRNHHRNGLGRVSDLALGYPGYNAQIPRENGFLSEILRAQGYATYAVGKWHLTPDDETSQASTRRTWPLGRGFDRWYGFHGGETHQFVPDLYCDNHAVRPPRSMDEGYHLTEDLADQAIRMIADLRAADADKRFFLYFATGACHSPHHAPTKWLEAERGRFDCGWDAWRDATFARQQDLGIVRAGAGLAPRPPWIPAWDDLDGDAQRVAARFMECFAAFLAHTDAQIGRLLDFLDETGDRANTLVVLVSDNGASGEGGRDGSLNDVRPINFDPAGPREILRRIDEIGTASTHNNYPWGWTMAGNTPFKRFKREVHEGGVADPCIFSWPGHISSPGVVRHAFTHAIDVPVTILDLIGIAVPPTIDDVVQSPIDGVSLAGVLTDAGQEDEGVDATSVTAPRTTQHFEMLGSRAIYHDGWKAVTFKPVGPVYDDDLDWNAPFDDDVWELYHVALDPTELHNVASDYPDKLAELTQLWWVEARRNQVLPLDNRPLYAIAHPKPSASRDRRDAMFWPGTSPVPEPNAPNIKNRFHEICADVTIATDDVASGVLLAQGSVLGGFSFHLLDGRLRWVHNLYGKRIDVVAGADVIAPGDHVLGMRYAPRVEGGGDVTLCVNDTNVATGSVRLFTSTKFNHTNTGMTCGFEHGPAVGPGYVAPFVCTATIHRVVLRVGDPVAEDPVILFERALSEQ